MMFRLTTSILTAVLLMPILLAADIAEAAEITAGQRAKVTEAAKGVLSRVMGEHVASRISLGVLPQVDGRDQYEYQSSPDLLSIRGSSVVAICRGVYDYLRAHHMGTVGWAGARLNIPDQWPDCSPIRGETPFKIRHCYNAVTFGYTTPYWTVERWSQELDWLAMHGYNMILNPIASEAILERVWLKMGLSRQEIEAYQTGPAHLPFHRMGCIRQVGGKLSADWHQSQIKLQHHVLKRMREIGIEPVVQGFAGFVPPAIKRIHPEIELHTTHWNGGFPESQRPVVMLPDHPVFAAITKDYLIEWQNEFGEAKYILVDSFNEMKLPKTGVPATEMLANYGKRTYEAITAAAPDAIWTLQGWMFNYQRYIWNKDTVKALLESVPNDRLLVLDYANDYNPNWDDFSGFHGRSWVMGYVPNMGGKTPYCGKMNFYASQVAKTLQHSGKGNLVGFTISGEGLENNEVLYELMSDTAWSKQAVELGPWLKDYAKNRYQSDDPALAQAWQQLHQSVYSWFTPHPAFGWQKMKLGRGNVYRDPKFFRAVQTFLSVADQHAENANYRDDAVEMSAIVLSLHAEDYFAAIAHSVSLGDMAVADRAAKRGVELLLDADRLLQSHSLHRLDRWIDLARAHSTSDRQSDFYETNAKQIITTWGPPVNDYACRMWSGLIRDFYVPRIQKVIASRIQGEPFDRRAWEATWLQNPGVSKVAVYANPAVQAAELVERAMKQKVPRTKASKLDAVAYWAPNDLKKDTWVTLDLPVTTEQLKRMKGVRFVFTGGHHRLDIRSVALIADGQQVALDRHPGEAGDFHRNNKYDVALPAGMQVNNTIRLRAEVRTTKGVSSNGMILLVQ
ncbi:alpha-N-acetylglucosaminidase [Verrucomicrobiaceae bacterium N1E253]|uniref:Alpha-N-acetylglucosaminidase n=1 Tax=Oceaniferula marina TaxID=2748318 RepID=A0A851GNQ7_9BACT|nr:alpha-N-acetylglucosaminidase [Oceaniferula marina]NWK57481.1 alpha-N-acetylglucosaminidase [Oceaniferula marina]